MAELPGQIKPVTPATPSRPGTRKGTRRRLPPEPQGEKRDRQKDERRPGHIDDYA
jgi:hypothetical protein